MRIGMRLALPVLFFTAAAGALAEVKESITVSMVEVPVTVLSRDGTPVRGLKASNFEIVDEGQRRPVASFDTVDFASVQSVKAMSPLNPAARRNFLLVFDLTFSSPPTLVRAQQAARDFVTKMAQRRDRVGVATIDVNHGFRLLTSFTTDRKLVDAAIANPQTFRGFDPLQLAGNFPFQEQGSMSATGDDKHGAQQEYNEMVRRQNQIEDQYNRDKVDRQVGLLSGLSATLRAVSGQKHLVLLSEGFDPRLIQGRGASVTEDQVRDSMAVEHGEIWKVDTDNQYGSAASLSLLDKLAQAARRSDVVIDAVDIRGVRTNVDASEGFKNVSNEGLHLLSNATGGTVFKNSNDLGSDFQRVVKAQEVVYVLGFQAPTDHPGRFHNLRIRLVDVPNARVSSRPGYYEAGAATQVERSLTNAEIVLNDIPQDSVHVAALAAPFATGAGDAQVPVILEVSGADLRAASGKGKTATVEIFVYAFDEDGYVRDSMYQRMALDMGKVGGALEKNGLKYYATLALPPGGYAIKSLVNVVESGAKGFTRSDVVVPRADEVALSQPYFFEPPGAWLMIKGGSHDKTRAPYPFEVNGEPFIPSAAVRLTGSGPHQFAVFVQNAAPDEVTIETSPKSTIVSRLKSANGSKFVFQLDSAETAPTLAVTMKKAGGRDERSSSIPLGR